MKLVPKKDVNASETARRTSTATAEQDMTTAALMMVCVAALVWVGGGRRCTPTAQESAVGQIK